VFRKKEKDYSYVDPDGRGAEQQNVMESFHCVENQFIVLAE
jgi:hypothetical protein